jgi:hypothetical protein
LAYGDDDLEWVAQGMACYYKPSDDEAKRAPGELICASRSAVEGALNSGLICIRTAVMVSMQSTKGSEVKYRESERAYSFHSWPKRSFAEPMRVWFSMKYPMPRYCKPSIPRGL